VIGKRLATFAIIGAMGFAVQLIAFAALTHASWTYPAATAAAVEAAVVHNFFWYERWTWADRPAAGSMAWRFARFNVGVGFVSIACNVAVVAALVRGGGVPPLAAHAVAVLVLGAVNFLIADRWIFSHVDDASDRTAAHSALLCSRLGGSRMSI
jgi:dolichol-phosphate mannosyltransferase